MIVSLVFSMCIKVCKNLYFHVKTYFWPNKLLLKNEQLSLSKGKNWILVGSFYESTPQLRKALGIRMVNSLKLSFHAHLKNTVKHIPTVSSFNLTIGLWKLYRYFPWNLIWIPMHADYHNEITFGTEITTSEKFQFYT